MSDNGNNSAFQILKRYQNFRYIMVLEGILVGVFAGIISIFYRIILEKADYILRFVLTYMKTHIWAVPVWFCVLIGAALTVGWLVKREPMISGSGIPQVEGEIEGQLDQDWLSVIVNKIIGGTICMGAGLSLGRAGPSIQIGAMAGKGVGKFLKVSRMEEKFLITCGASAGLSAAFNAPLAGAMFVLEEIHRNFSEVILLSVMASSVTADFISKHIFGLSPVFTFDVQSMMPLNLYWLLVIFGIIVGMLGAVYNYMVVESQDLYKKIKWLKPEYRMVIPFAIAWSLGFIMPDVLGGGYSLVEILLEERFVLKTMVVVFIVKFMFSMISFGSGAPGGIFFPLFVLGAYIGGIYGTFVVQKFGFDTDLINNFIILGMAGYFTAIVRKPLTGIILISEMTGTFTHLLSLSTISVIAYITAEMLKSKPIYEVLFKRLITNAKTNSDKEVSESPKVLAEFPVELGSKADGKMIREVRWPEGCLIVSVKRGGVEIMPGGSTLVSTGDILVVMTSEEKFANMHEQILEQVERKYENR